jgi:hypothetical protein
MKSPLAALLVALFVFSGGSGLLESTANAGGKSKADGSGASRQPKSSATAQFTPAVEARNFQVPYYLIQVEYARPVRTPGRPGGGGHGGGRPRYTYSWFTVAESTDLEEAEFIYALFNLGWEEGVLDEIAPDLGYGTFPTRVQMITEYRTVEPVLSAE